MDKLCPAQIKLQKKKRTFKEYESLCKSIIKLTNKNTIHLPYYIDCWRVRLECFLKMLRMKKNLDKQQKEVTSSQCHAVLKDIYFKPRVPTEILDSDRNCTHYLFCSLTYDGIVYTTDAQMYKAGEEMHFVNTFEFKKLIDNFNILLQVWKISVVIKNEKFKIKKPILVPIAKHDVHMCTFYETGKQPFCAEQQQSWYNIKFGDIIVKSLEVKGNSVHCVKYSLNNEEGSRRMNMELDGKQIHFWSPDKARNITPVITYNIDEVLPDFPIQIAIGQQRTIRLIILEKSEMEKPNPTPTILTISTFKPRDTRIILKHLSRVSAIVNFTQQNKLDNNNMQPVDCVYHYLKVINQYYG